MGNGLGPGLPKKGECHVCHVATKPGVIFLLMAIFFASWEVPPAEDSSWLVLYAFKPPPPHMHRNLLKNSLALDDMPPPG